MPCGATGHGVPSGCQHHAAGQRAVRHVCRRRERNGARLGALSSAEGLPLSRMPGEPPSPPSGAMLRWRVPDPGDSTSVGHDACRERTPVLPSAHPLFGSAGHRSWNSGRGNGCRPSLPPACPRRERRDACPSSSASSPARQQDLGADDHCARWHRSDNGGTTGPGRSVRAWHPREATPAVTAAADAVTAESVRPAGAR